jgi:hypothetical protein
VQPGQEGQPGQPYQPYQAPVTPAWVPPAPVPPAPVPPASPYGQPGYPVPAQPGYGQAPQDPYAQPPQDPYAQPRQDPPTQVLPSPVYGVAGAPPAQYPVSGTPMSQYPPYGYQPGYPVEPPKRRIWPALLITASVLVVLVIVVSIGALALSARKNHPATPAALPTSAGPFHGDLRTLLVPRPAGSTKDSNEGNGNDDGTVTIEQAAQTYSDADFGLTHMREFGYQQGATESWHEADDYSVQIVLFQFATSTDTAEFVSKLEDGGDSDDYWNTRGDVPQVPTGRYYVSAEKNDNGNYNFEIWFSHNDVAARMNAFGPDATDVEKLKTLAQKQFALLP